MGQSEINYDAIPGDAALVDSDHQLAALHSEKNKDIVLIPTPSDDPDDPLNWSDKRKNLALLCMVVYTYGVGIPGSAIYSILPQISLKTGLSIAQLNTSTGYMFLFLGLSSFFFQPMALQYGKRNVYLCSIFAASLLSIWAPHCKTNAEWIGSKILGGFFGGPIEALCGITVSDVSFQHQLAKNMSIYAFALLTSNFIAPVVAGFISDGIGWEWVMYLSSIWSAVCFVFLFFFMEETNYERKLNLKRILEQIEIDGIPVTTETLFRNASADEKRVEVVLSHQTIEERLQEVNEAFIAESSDSAPQNPLKTYRDKISFTDGMRSKFILPHLLMGPFKMVQFPVVLWCGFLYGSSLVWFNLLNATEALVLSSPPYNFSSSMCGLAYLSPTIFSLIFQLAAGYLSDWAKITIARRRGGLSYAEDRLWVLVIYMIFGLLSSIGWGAGAYYGMHWFFLVFCMGMLGGSGVFAIISAVAYTSDTYHELETEAMVIVMAIRNLISFACSYGLTDWVLNMGYRNAFISSGCILFFCNGTFLVMRFTGRYWRNKTKTKYWKLVEENRRVLNS